LQLNLAMRVAIDDDDEEQGDASIERDADATFVAEASDEILSIRQQLAATTLERDTLFTRLQATLDELDAAVRQREQVVGQKLDLEQELGEVRADAKAANDELAVARADVKELAQRTAAYANEVEAVRTRAAQIERIAAAAEDRTEVLERELADVVQLRVDYEVRGEELAQARAQVRPSANDKTCADILIFPRSVG
jgi:chromosome segregation ATPase